MTPQLVTLTRSDARPRHGGPNWEQWLTVHDAATGQPLALLLEILRPDGSISYRDPCTRRRLRGDLDSIIRAAMRRAG